MKKIIVILTVMTSSCLLSMDNNNTSSSSKSSLLYPLKETFSSHDFVINVQNNTGDTKVMYSYIGSKEGIVRDIEKKEIPNTMSTIFVIQRCAEFFIITNCSDFPQKKPVFNERAAKILSSSPGYQPLYYNSIADDTYKGVVFFCPDNYKTLCGGYQYFNLTLTDILGTPQPAISQESRHIQYVPDMGY